MSVTASRRPAATYPPYMEPCPRCGRVRRMKKDTLGRGLLCRDCAGGMTVPERQAWS